MNVFPPSLWVIILLITALSWLSVARLVRGEVLTLRGALSTCRRSGRWAVVELAAHRDRAPDPELDRA